MTAAHVITCLPCSEKSASATVERIWRRSALTRRRWRRCRAVDPDGLAVGTLTAQQAPIEVVALSVGDGNLKAILCSALEQVPLRCRDGDHVSGWTVKRKRCVARRIGNENGRGGRASLALGASWTGRAEIALHDVADDSRSLPDRRRCPELGNRKCERRRSRSGSSRSQRDQNSGACDRDTHRLAHSSRSALNWATYPDASMRAPITVVPFDLSAAVSAFASACSVSTTMPSAPKA